MGFLDLCIAPVQRKWTAFDWPSIMIDPGGSI